MIYFRYIALENGDLSIENVNPSDSGVFQCFATNPAGEKNAATWLRVLSMYQGNMSFYNG